MASGRGVVRADLASRDHYAALGVGRGASEAEIAHAYKALARRFHPDKNLGRKEEAEVSFKRIAEAYEVLRDPRKRRQYDLTQGSCAWSWCGTAEGHEVEPQWKAGGFAVALFVLIATPRAVLPGLVVAFAGLVLHAQRRAASKWAWCALAVFIASNAVRLRSSPSAQPLRGVQPPSGGLVLGGVEELAGLPSSGEEVLLNDGRWIKVSDPQHAGEGVVDQGWQQRLVTEMTAAIKSGQEQVVTVFSRRDCPSCDTLVPVIRRAIQQRRSQHTVQERRRGGLRGAGQGSGGDRLAFLGTLSHGRTGIGFGGGRAAAPCHALLAAPLRVFVLDAAEFPHLTEAFHVKVFPTVVAWGAPDAIPMAARDSLDDTKFQELLKSTVALQVSPGDGVPAASEGKQAML